MEREARVFMDIGAGYGERLIRRARENPDKIFIVVDIDEPRDLESLPQNVRWFFGGITRERPKLRLVRAGIVDEIDIDAVFQSLYAEETFEDTSMLILNEVKRVLHRKGILYIREPKYMLEKVLFLLERSGLSVEKINAIPLPEAKEHSVSIEEAALLFEAGHLEMEPSLITVRKKGKLQA